MKVPLFFRPLLCLLLMGILPNAADAAFAEMLSLTHDCGNGGSVEFQLTDPDNQGDYTYRWDHGPEHLALDGLPPGTYTLFVQNFYGCQEEYEIEILDVSSCNISAYVSYPFDPCRAIIQIYVLNGNGEAIGEEALNIIWHDGNTAGLYRNVFRQLTRTYTVTISIPGENGTNCCKETLSITVWGNPNCGFLCEKDMIVNEFNRNQDGGAQFAEILVTGQCECEGYTDIRGFILDDNNGLLIPAGPNLSFSNLDEVLGTNMGYLSFAYHDNWQAIPNGSLIVIYDQRDGSLPELQADDPEDSNGDGVYVLSAANTTYFNGKSGNWNATSQQMEYTGSLETPEWSKVAVSPYADGVQLREPAGEYHHGVSTGSTPISADNTFPLWLTDNYSEGYNVRLEGDDPQLKEDYAFEYNPYPGRTPGTGNSPTNTELIGKLKDCDYQPIPYNEGGNTKSLALQERLTAFPNPFIDEVTLVVQATTAGQGTLRIRTVSGQLIQEEIKVVQAGENQYTIHFDRSIPAGLLLAEFLFPSGEKQSLKITHLQID